jgi:hypothetical protein
VRGQAVEVPTPIALLAGRENPETHEGYQVCLRCTAYRDRGNASPGAGAAGVTGTGEFRDGLIDRENVWIVVLVRR